MLGNKDFAQMISSGAAMSGSGDGRTRFDLKQVSKWDRENNKALTKKKTESVFVPKEKKENDNVFGYRDRALERRKDINTEETKYEELASKLDAEQTKFLGGDLQHTHLVKGLDYALLDKIRSESNKEAIRLKYGDGNATTSSSSSAPVAAAPSSSVLNANAKPSVALNETQQVERHPSDVETSTALGLGLKRFLFPKPEAAPVKSTAPALYESVATKYSAASGATAQQQGSSSGGGGVRRPVVASSAAQVLARTFYQFSLSSSSSGGSGGSGNSDSSSAAADRVDEIPVTLMKSIKEVDLGESTTTYDPPAELIARIAALYDGGKSMISLQQYAVKRKRKEKEAQLLALKAAALQAQVSGGGGGAVNNVAKGDFDSIYDDDVPLGRYVPVGAVEEGEIAEAILRQEEGGGGATAMEGVSTSTPSSGSLFADLSSIYGDNANAATAAATSSAAHPSSSSSTGLARGIFDSVRTTTSFVPAAAAATASAASGSSSTGAIANAPGALSAADEELMRPVRDLLHAQANKERAQAAAAAARLAAQSSARTMVVGTNAAGVELVHRDVFATTKDKVVKAGKSTLAGGEGDAFGAQGSYDLFPETAEYEVFSDDDAGDDEDKPPAAKKAHTSAAAFYDDGDDEAAAAGGGAGGGGGRFMGTAGMEGSIKKSLLKTASTPWNRAHGEGGGGGAAAHSSRPAKQAPSGQNRAARRAAAGGDK